MAIYKPMRLTPKRKIILRGAGEMYPLKTLKHDQILGIMGKIKEKCKITAYRGPL